MDLMLNISGLVLGPVKAALELQKTFAEYVRLLSEDKVSMHVYTPGEFWKA